MFRIAIIIAALFVAACGDVEQKPFDFEENGNNQTTGNNGTTANNGTTGSNGTTGNNSTTGNNNGCVIVEPPEHRPVSEACDDFRPPGDGSEVEGGDCSADEDCIDNMGATNGRCSLLPRQGAMCTYDACITDGDCGADSVCHCEGGWGTDNNVCKTGNCVTDADCGDSGYCSPSLSDCGDYGGITGWFCRTCEDECVSDDDCPDNVDGGGRGYCAFDGQKWTCSNSFCVG